jgi:hypothetical protein
VACDGGQQKGSRIYRLAKSYRWDYADLPSGSPNFTVWPTILYICRNRKFTVWLAIVYRLGKVILPSGGINVTVWISKKGEFTVWQRAELPSG